VEVLRGLRTGQLVALVDAAIATVASALPAQTGLEQEGALEDLAELRSLIVEMGPRTTLPGLLDRVSLGTDETSATGISLMTLHASKGLEFDVVFVAGLEEGLLPHRRSLEREEDIAEERRLCYVGMTRARHQLYLSYAHSRLQGGVFSSGHPSRFVQEIGNRFLTRELSPKRRSKPRLDSVALSDRVRHPRWGDGVVIRVDGAGRETLVTVRFEIGEQRLQLCHAPLTLLHSGRSDVLAG
jgi:DNA helicase-2/ATP-dependent DNA helicase PcrA